jgi:hypothetical protein
MMLMMLMMMIIIIIIIIKLRKIKGAADVNAPKGQPIKRDHLENIEISGQSSWLQIQRPRFDSRHDQIF